MPHTSSLFLTCRSLLDRMPNSLRTQNASDCLPESGDAANAFRLTSVAGSTRLSVVSPRSRSAGRESKRVTTCDSGANLGKYPFRTRLGSSSRARSPKLSRMGAQPRPSWEGGAGQLEHFARANRDRLHDSHRRGSDAWGHWGIVVSAMGDLPVTIYTGELFDNNVGVISP